MSMNFPIGVFDSGYGGLTILREFQKKMPDYDFIYFGDNAHTPYGTRSYEVVYEYTRKAVIELFDMGCHLVILACNTASAKALRTIQQKDLPLIAPDNRVLGVIRPSVEYVSENTRNGHVGVLATPGTVASLSYPLELKKWSGGRVKMISQQSCPMWVPIVENNEIGTPGADYFIEKNICSLFEKDPDIDSLILGCTHFPLLIDSIRKYIPHSVVQIVEQGSIVADHLVFYLKRHPEIDKVCSQNGETQYFTTEQSDLFESHASLFMGHTLKAKKISN